MNIDKLLLISLLAIQTPLHGAASSSAHAEENDTITSKELINLYTDVFLQRVGASTKLTHLTQALLSDGTGNVTLSADVHKFAHTRLDNSGVLRLPAQTVAELIYRVRNMLAEDTLETLKIKRLLYTAVQHNLLHNPTYNSLEEEEEYYKQNALANIEHQLTIINDQLKQHASEDKSKWLQMA